VGGFVFFVCLFFNTAVSLRFFFCCFVFCFLFFLSAVQFALRAASLPHWSEKLYPFASQLSLEKTL